MISLVKEDLQIEQLTWPLQKSAVLKAFLFGESVVVEDSEESWTVYSLICSKN